MIAIKSLTLSAATALLLAAASFGAAAQPSELPQAMRLDGQTDTHIQTGVLVERIAASICMSFHATREVTTTTYVVVNPAGKVVPGLDAHFGFVGDEVYGDPVKIDEQSVFSCSMFDLDADTNSLFVPH